MTDKRALRNLKIEDEQVRKELLEDLPVLASSFSAPEFEDFLKSLCNYPECKAYIDGNFPGLLGTTLQSFPQVMDIMGKSKTFRRKAVESFDDIKANILGQIGVLESVEDFYRFIDTVRGEEELSEDIAEYDKWKRLYDKVPSTYVKGVDDPTSIGDFLKLAFSENEEDRKLFQSMVRASGKTSTFAYILLGKKPVREEKMMILESLTEGNLDSIEFLGSGTSGIVFKSGKKVIKFATNLTNKPVPYHPRLLMPFFRKTYDDLTTMEVYNFGKVKSAKITDEKLLEIYKELKRDGIIWTDAQKDNLVELLEDNTLPEYNLGKDFNLYGFLKDDRYPTTEHKVLKKGDIVICDLNNLYAIDDPLAELRIGMPDKVILDYLEHEEEEEQGIQPKEKRLERDEGDGR